MKLERLRLLNFRQHADTVVEFGSGLTGIIGPNGSGKSTLLEAIAWAIYGTAAARGTRDSLRFVRAGARASVRVELEFELGGHRYRVVRGLTSAELYLDAADAPIADSVTSVTELLTRRLGMTRDEFFNTYFTGQKELSVMAAMKPTERAQFLSHVLGYERLRAAQRLLRDRRRTLVAQIAGIRQGMPDAEFVATQLATAERQLADARERRTEAHRARAAAAALLEEVQPRWDAMQRERERLQMLRSELRVTDGELAALERERTRLDRELSDIAAARVELAKLAPALAPYRELAAEFQRLDVLAREEGRRQALAGSRDALAAELERMRERRGRLDSAPALETEITGTLTDRRAALEQQDAQLETLRTEWVRDRQAAETKRQALREQFADLKDQRGRLMSAGDEGVCPTCRRPLGGSLRAVLELLDGQIETVQVDGNYYKQRVEQLAEPPENVRTIEENRRAAGQEIATLERRLMKVQVAVAELAQLANDLVDRERRLGELETELAAIPAGYDSERHTFVRAELDRLLPIDGHATRLSAQTEREPVLLREREQSDAQLAAVAKRREALSAQCDATVVPEADFASLRAEYDRAVAALRGAELASVGAESDSVAAEAARATAQAAGKELAGRQRLLDELTGTQRLHDELDRAFTDLRTDLNFKLRPELSELASAYLVELTDGRYSELELDDQYNILVLEEGIPKPVISGGEEDLANLVLRLAISQMIADRAGQPFSLLVLDEIFGSLDELRRASVVDLLRRLQDRFDQVILITHIESVREMLDHVIAVRYDAESGASVVQSQDDAGGAADDLPSAWDAAALAPAAAD